MSHFKNITSKTLLPFAITLAFVGCTTHTTNEVNRWLRLRSAEPTTIIPHMWDIGDSGTTVQRNDNTTEGTWIDTDRQGRSSVRLYALKNQPFAIAVEDEWGGEGKFYITVYRRNSPTIKIKTAKRFDTALPSPSGEIVVFRENRATGDDSGAMTTYNLQGTILTTEVISLKNPPTWGRGFIGICGKRYIFEDKDQKLLVVANGTLTRLIQKSQVSCEIPTCAGYARSCPTVNYTHSN